MRKLEEEVITAMVVEVKEEEVSEVEEGVKAEVNSIKRWLNATSAIN